MVHVTITMVSAISTLVGDELGGVDKYRGTVTAPNGFLYGIPSCASRVAKFNPIDKSITYIGPDFGGRWKWLRGAKTDSGIIYCPPYFYGRGILKIDTNTDTVTELDVNLLPEPGDEMWESCAVALDGCVYFMPKMAVRIMKLDPNNNDTMVSVGDDLGVGDSINVYISTVVGIDGCVYGIPSDFNHIVKYNPTKGSTSFVRGEADENLEFRGNGILGRDGCIYAANCNG